jgi:hypothetical protein
VGTMNRSRITVRDFINSLETIHKFVTFGEKVGKAIGALARAGVDISKFNPLDFGSIIRMAGALRQQGYDLDDVDIECLKEEFEEILDMDISEIYNAINVVNRFSSALKRATQTIQYVSKQLPTDPSAMNNLFAMFGLQPKIPNSSDINYKVEEEAMKEEKEIGEEELEELKDVVKWYKEKRKSNA